jgi:DNA repair protein RecN (Recombination protein N)
MLKLLHIENYALIERLEIDFEQGFTVITGETGAGKSILLGALSMILGQRADSQLLSNSAKKCIVEGVFDVSKLNIRDFFEKHQLDYEPLSILRREILPQGKSRAFVNDTPVNLQVLRDLTGMLIDIHSQHQNLMIGESSFQFDVVDSITGNLGSVESYREAFRQLQKGKRELLQLEAEEARMNTDIDYYQFQLDELNKSPLSQVDFLAWEIELERIRHAEEIALKLAKARYLIVDNEQNILDLMREVLLQIKPLERFSPDFASLGNRLHAVLVELKDIGQEVSKLSSDVSHDPERALELELVLDNINKLLLKHRAQDIDGLIAIRNEFAEKIESVSSISDLIAKEKQRLFKIEQDLIKQAKQVSEIRRKALPDIENELVAMLKQLGMPGARFVIHCKTSETLHLHGVDQIDFLFSANADTEPGEISRIASGGELSRLMLCVKSLISKKNLLPSIIFDEIDTGISGEIGGKIADILQNMAQHMQVIAITHLPQIAARGQKHMQVYKISDDNKTKTRVKTLHDGDRASEIAKMLGGENPTTSMIETAGELLMKNR